MKHNMKTINKFLALAALVGLSSCASSFLEKEPHGSTLTQAQYERLDNTLEGSMRGIYAMLYTKTSTDHDEFGKRSIDMYGDLLCGDMALTSYTYGWFYTDERGMTYTARTGTVWSSYYKMLHNVNMVIKSVNEQTQIIQKVAEFGLPNAYNSSRAELYVINATAEKNDTLCTYTETEASIANYYAQALTMRGYVLSNLINLYCPTSAEIASGGSTLEQTLSFPLYNENNMDQTQPLAKLSEVYTQLESDLTTAINYFDAFDDIISRPSKLTADISVARGILAYSYLNKANPNAASTGDAYRQAYTNALNYAKDVIEKGGYVIIPNANVYTTGFNDVNNASWIWGQEVTTETATGLASFFGQVDIHSYSYAWAGDTKVIDQRLYDSIPSFDARKGWFNDGSANATFRLCPDRKFFSAKSPTSTKSGDIDREWLSDNVYMRIESMYLIAAEASYRLGNYDDAKNYLCAITDQRVSTAEGASAAYSNFVSSLNSTNLLRTIEYNWRVELWGEGYGLMTFRRLAPETTAVPGYERRRGSNHSSESGAEIKPNDDKYKFVMPSSESSYNPNL